ncbi:MAG TPA: hypothetical protein VKZ86_01510, partial [Cyclobacteriaceae bacterium]|nr:hypothetical protein [Cyclobacteriaceae bacterium]
LSNLGDKGAYISTFSKNHNPQILTQIKHFNQMLNATSYALIEVVETRSNSTELPINHAVSGKKFLEYRALFT